MESCGGALGHSNANDKSVGSFTWTAPAVGNGAVTFKAAVVVYKSKWNIISTNSIAIDPSYVPPPTTVSSSTTTSS
ncbi:hypothetical protein BKA69DRAFT_1104595 [Paraphysoderma sedebokerense]|nr:hypothetical protein BKA69DRAFT_1104595 [Paraphysoderma sedebokerense]